MFLKWTLGNIYHTHINVTYVKNLEMGPSNIILIWLKIFSFIYTFHVILKSYMTSENSLKQHIGNFREPVIQKIVNQNNFYQKYKQFIFMCKACWHFRKFNIVKWGFLYFHKHFHHIQSYRTSCWRNKSIFDVYRIQKSIYGG